MPVLKEFEAPIAKEKAAVARLVQEVADLKAQLAKALSAQDVADTLAAVQAEADAADAVAPQVVSPPVLG